MAYTYDVSLSVPPTAEDSGPSMAELSGELNGLLTQLRQISDAMNSAFSTGQVQALTKSTAAAANAQSRLAATTRKAGAAARRSLADFDELNRLQSAAGSSGSGSSSKGKSGKSSGTSESAAGDTLLDGWQDFFDKLQKNLAPALALWQTAWQEIRQAAADVWPVIRQAAQDCWDNTLSPLLANLRDVFLPGIANSFSEAFAPLVSGVAVTAIQVFGDWFVWLCGLVTDAVNSILLPVLSLILNVWQGLMDGISAAWTAYGQPLMEGVVLAFQNVENLITLLWETTLKPFFQFCIAAVRDLWNQHLQPLWNDLTMLFAEIGLCVLDFWNNVLAPVASWLVSTLGPVFEQVFEFAAGTVIGAVGIIAEWIDVAVNLFRGIVEFLDTTFRGCWDGAWEGISGTVTRVWNGITTSVKDAVKTILVLSDGTELCGGGPGDAVVSLTHRSAVNSGQDLTIGSACSDSIEAELWCEPGGSLRITEGDVITCYRQSPGGARTKIGVFLAEKPTRTKRSTYKITAYDGMSRLDADFSAWLYAHQGCYAEGDPGRYPVPENPGDWILTAAMDEAAVDLPLTI